MSGTPIKPGKSLTLNSPERLKGVNEDRENLSRLAVCPVCAFILRLDAGYQTFRMPHRPGTGFPYSKSPVTGICWKTERRDLLR
jgi:hypothetical protein